MQCKATLELGSSVAFCIDESHAGHGAHRFEFSLLPEVLEAVNNLRAQLEAMKKGAAALVLQADDYRAQRDAAIAERDEALELARESEQHAATMTKVDELAEKVLGIDRVLTDRVFAERAAAIARAEAAEAKISQLEGEAKCLAEWYEKPEALIGELNAANVALEARAERAERVVEAARVYLYAGHVSQGVILTALAAYDAAKTSGAGLQSAAMPEAGEEPARSHPAPPQGPEPGGISSADRVSNKELARAIIRRLCPLAKGMSDAQVDGDPATLWLEAVLHEHVVKMRGMT